MEVRKSGTPCFFMLIPTIKYYLNELIHLYQELIIVVRESIQRSIGLCKMSA